MSIDDYPDKIKRQRLVNVSEEVYDKLFSSDNLNYDWKVIMDANIINIENPLKNQRGLILLDYVFQFIKYNTF